MKDFSRIAVGLLLLVLAVYLSINIDDSQETAASDSGQTESNAVVDPGMAGFFAGRDDVCNSSPNPAICSSTIRDIDGTLLRGLSKNTEEAQQR